MKRHPKKLYFKMKTHKDKKNISTVNKIFNCQTIFKENGLELGRSITTDNKSKYCIEHSDDLIIFNANVVSKCKGKIWYGDLNLSEDFDKLKNIADIIREDLYVLMEGDAINETQKRNTKKMIENARVIIRCIK